MNSRLLDHCCAIADGSLTAEALADLQAILHSDESARRDYIDFMRLVSLMERERVSGVQGSGFSVQNQTPSLMLRTGRSWPGRSVGVRRLRIADWRLRIGAAIAALIVLAVSTWFVWPPSATPQSEIRTPQSPPVAMLSDLSPDAAFAAPGSPGSDQPMRPGADLPPGPIRLLAGSAQIMFTSTAVVDLTGPCEFRMIDDNHSALMSGRITAYVPAVARGFTLELADGTRIVDLGTRFFVDVESTSRAVIGVIEGQVRVEAGTHSRVLAVGEVVTLDQQRMLVQRTPLDGLAAYWPLDVDADTRWGTTLRGWLSAGATMVSSEGVGGAVRLTDGGHIEVDGDGPGIGDGDLAVSLWFKRSPDPRTNLRLLSYGGGHDDDPGLAIFGSDRNVNAIVRGDNRRVGVGAATPGPNQWHHLAVNMDRDDAITLYLDGRRAGAADLKSFAGMTLTPGHPLWIGGQPGADLGWEGLIDEVRVYRRVLSEQEILELARPAGLRHAADPQHIKTHTASPHKESLR